jgi:hypothetical protein
MKGGCKIFAKRELPGLMLMILILSAMFFGGCTYVPASDNTTENKLIDEASNQTSEPYISAVSTAEIQQNTAEAINEKTPQPTSSYSLSHVFPKYVMKSRDEFNKQLKSNKSIGSKFTEQGFVIKEYYTIETVETNIAIEQYTVSPDLGVIQTHGIDKLDKNKTITLFWYYTPKSQAYVNNIISGGSYTKVKVNDQEYYYKEFKNELADKDDTGKRHPALAVVWAKDGQCFELSLDNAVYSESLINSIEKLVSKVPLN